MSIVLVRFRIVISSNFQELAGPPSTGHLCLILVKRVTTGEPQVMTALSCIILPTDMDPLMY